MKLITNKQRYVEDFGKEVFLTQAEAEQKLKEMEVIDMSKEEICEKVRSICKEENVEFLFITEGKSCWSVSKNEHIRKVAHFHKENENKCATDRA